ncbi:MAG: histidine phosphatase family protein [Devosiaceae bacterium]|nr:histidine phosphatase family protein [Devosiaceae bacterium MH13]
MITLRYPLVFIRHGQTDWNREGRLQGGKDIPLNALGQTQATRNGRRLRGLAEDGALDLSTFSFVASPLGRCLQTMGRVRQALELPTDEGFAIDPRLTEITFGEWEGSTYTELHARDPGIVDAREADKFGFAPPGGESYAMLTQRITGWLEGLDEPTIAVSHGGVSRAVRGLLLDLDPDEVPYLDAPQDKLYLFEDGQGVWL